VSRQSNPKPRKELIKRVHDSVLAAELHYQIYWIYKNRDDRAKYIDTLNRYLGFFAQSIQAHFIALVVVLYATYEDRRDTINLARLYEDSPAELKATVSTDFTRAKSIWKKIAVLRNNHFGHVTERLEIDAVFETADVRYDEIKELSNFRRNSSTAFRTLRTEAHSLIAWIRRKIPTGSSRNLGHKGTSQAAGGRIPRPVGCRARNEDFDSMTAACRRGTST
jgi:hypothetical protein